ncbi:unnamed protein product [Parnassius apollo]|uniref:(apollo) hypothetical protein n=1 Tax=Parnassius apollo TaxID=110799 RepID=A0A8S3WHV6_PARAO|nr:unnamed protein product [Parnassius apollo]
MINEQRLQKIRDNILSNLNSRRDNMENNSSLITSQHTILTPETENSTRNREVDVHPFIVESNTPVHTLSLTLQTQPNESVISTQASEAHKTKQ